jgi:hypothetical protein
VADRGDDEGVGDAQAAKIRNALALYRPLRAVEGVEFRFHRTVLYNSIYRADDQVRYSKHLTEAHLGRGVTSRGIFATRCMR